MVPFTVMEYYGGLSGNFDVNGVGIGPWQQIYLCNGLNGTPDKRGRVGVGAIVGVGGGALNPAVDPSNPSNPNYALNLATGANTVTLSATQIPAHTHSVTLTDPGHHHFIAGSDSTASASPINATTPIASGGSAGTNTAYELHPSVLSATVGKTSTSFTGVNATIGSTGGGLSHANIQPSIACYYIMYIPNP
jgi:microcystin-dependent protein